MLLRELLGLLRCCWPSLLLHCALHPLWGSVQVGPPEPAGRQLRLARPPACRERGAAGRERGARRAEPPRPRGAGAGGVGVGGAGGPPGAGKSCCSSRRGAPSAAAAAGRGARRPGGRLRAPGGAGVGVGSPGERELTFFGAPAAGGFASAFCCGRQGARGEAVRGAKLRQPDFGNGLPWV